MISLNVPNVITISIIAVGAWIIFQMLYAKLTGASA